MVRTFVMVGKVPGSVPRVAGGDVRGRVLEDETLTIVCSVDYNYNFGRGGAI